MSRISTQVLFLLLSKSKFWQNCRLNSMKIRCFDFPKSDFDFDVGWLIIFFRWELIFGFLAFSISYNWLWIGKRILTKVEKAFFVIFLSSYAKSVILGPKMWAPSGHHCCLLHTHRGRGEESQLSRAGAPIVLVPIHSASSHSILGGNSTKSH
jgi:hypothetical protein